MKEVTFTMFDALGSVSGCGLCIPTEQKKTPEGVREFIDRRNRTMREEDHDPEQFYIYRETYSRIFDDNGHLVTETHFKCRTELYPAEPDKTPRYYVMYYDRRDSGYGCECFTSTFDPAKAVDRCNHISGTYVKDRTGKVIFENPKK